MSAPWRVDAEAAVQAWQRRDRPAPERVLSLLEWFFAWGDSGPPGPDDGALPVPLEDEPMFSFRVPEVEVIITYYVVTHERLVLVKHIEDVSRLR